MRPFILLGVVALLALGACDDPWLAPGGDRATATTHVRVPSGDIDLVGATIVDGTVVSSAGAELGLVEMPGVRYRDPSGISPRAGDGGRAEGEWELAASRSRTRTEIRPRNDGGTICWYLVTYRISTGEIVSEELLFCSGGGGGVCTREQESIADEYDNAQLYRGGRSWSCEEVGGSSGSQHMEGNGGDFAPSSGRNLTQQEHDALRRQAQRLGATGISRYGNPCEDCFRYKGHIHIDWR